MPLLCETADDKCEDITFIVSLLAKEYDNGLP